MTDELRKAVLPINTAVKQNLKDRDDRARVLKKPSGTRAADIEAERAIRIKETAEIKELVDSNDALKDVACPSGLYELTGMTSTFKSS
jgi:ubiquitin carboxyl-terminal hydrolase 14